MAEQIQYSNSDKLVAVVEQWAKPLMAQLPPPYSILAPMVSPIVANYIRRIPDSSVPSVANSIVDNAVKQGCVKLWNVTLDNNDLLDLQRLIKINLPCDDKPIGYEVKLK